MEKKKEFLYIAKLLNEKLDVVPLLFGSLGLEQRLHTNLNAEFSYSRNPDRCCHLS